jgi:hypothetical protein
LIDETNKTTFINSKMAKKYWDIAGKKR